MAIQELSAEIKSAMDKELKLKANSVGCRIKVEDDVVRVTVPVDKDVVKNLTFSKREVRELFEKLYAE